MPRASHLACAYEASAWASWASAAASLPSASLTRPWASARDWSDAELALAELLVEHGDLVLAQLHARLGLPDGSLGLLLARADLLVVEHGDDLPGLDLVALAHGDLADAPRGLGRDGRVVALDPPAHGDHAGRARPAGPARSARGAIAARPEHEEGGDDGERAPARRHARRRGGGAWSAASPRRQQILDVLHVRRRVRRRDPSRRSASTRSRKRRVAKKKTRLPTRLRWVSTGSTGRKSPSRTPRATMRCTAVRHADRLVHDLGLEVLAAGQDLAQHHRAEVRMLARHLAHRGDQLAEHVRRRPGRVGQPLHARDDLGEGGAQDGQVELPLAAEVVVDHRLVDAGLGRRSTATGTPS